MQKMQEAICQPTGDPIIKRFQGHFISIRSRDLTSDVGRHFKSEGNAEAKDIEIHVLDFIYTAPMTPYGLTLQSKNRIQLDSPTEDHVTSGYQHEVQDTSGKGLKTLVLK